MPGDALGSLGEAPGAAKDLGKIDAAILAQHRKPAQVAAEQPRELHEPIADDKLALVELAAVYRLVV